MREGGREKQVQMYYVHRCRVSLSLSHMDTREKWEDRMVLMYIRTYVCAYAMHTKCCVSETRWLCGCGCVGVHVGVRVNCCLPLEEICPALEQSVSELSGVRSSHSTCSKAGGCRRPGRR